MFRVIRTCGWLLFLLGVSLNSNAHLEAQTTPKACGISQGHDVEIVMMLDFTGSSKAVHVKAEKDAVLSLLEYFQTSVPKPKVALGWFNVTSVIEVPLTYDYNSIRTKLAALPAHGTGGTQIKVGLEAARVHLAKNGLPLKQNYIMLFSDGQTAGAPEVKTLSKMIKDEGTYIFAIHYPVQTVAGKEIPGAELMRDHIASRPSSGFYHSVAEDLPGKVKEISMNIGCEDGISCTTDTCNLATGFCESRELDGDHDGVGDCSDKCPNFNDADLGPEHIMLDEDGDGILTCRDDCPDDPNKIKAGYCGCGVKDVDLNGDGFIDCLGCTKRDLSANPAAVKAAITAHARAVTKLAKKAAKTGNRKTAKAAKSITTAAAKSRKEAVKLSAALPGSVLTCRTSRCITGIEYKTGVERIRAINTDLYNKSKALYSGLVQKEGVKKSNSKMLQNAAKAYSAVYSLMRGYPDGVPQCRPG